MRQKLNELFEARNKLVEDQKIMVDKADEETREFTAEETEAYEKMDVDFEGLTTQIDELRDKITKADERKTKLEERQEYLSKSTFPDELKTQVADVDTRDAQKIKEDANLMDTFKRALVYGVNNLNDSEVRALQADQDTKGGYLIAPEQFVNELIKDVDNQVYMRQLCKVFPVMNADSLGVPVLEADLGNPDFINELGTGAEDSTMKFAKRDLRPHPCAQMIRISNKLLRAAIMSADSIVRDRLAYKMSVVLENAYLNGTGVNQPLGIFTASNDGIGTGQDVSEGNITTAIKADGLINCMYSLKTPYMAKGTWLFHRTAIRNIRKLKDGEGNYIWQAGIAGDRPATILDRPYFMSEYCPSTFTTGLYVGMFGDFSQYWIVDALNMQIQVLDQLFARSAQIGYISRMETDGAPVLEEAWARVKLA